MAALRSVELWLVNLWGATGREQKGSRPAIIWRDLDHVKIVIAIPLTSVLERGTLPYTVRIEATAKNGLEKASVALVFQIRALDKSSLVKKLGVLDDYDFESIEGTLRELLRL
jgi:mRNA-degrading endonuclease toxin of MazEF toxin-antitoxin module